MPRAVWLAGWGAALAAVGTSTTQAPTRFIAAAGDIATCGSGQQAATAAVLDSLLPPTLRLDTALVATLGDNAYETGSKEDYAACYHPTWGRHKARTRPAVGNHEYLTAEAGAYFEYFGAAAGDPARGYYSYDHGAWHVVVLNSNCAAVGGCVAGSPQERWLRADLAAHPRPCTLAYWHHPRYSSGAVHGNALFMSDLWQALMDFGVDLALSGHEHVYERFAPLDADGAPHPAGVRSFVVGTGGRALYRFGPAQPGSQVRDNSSFGVLWLTLRPAGYDWQFVPAPPGAFTDRGSDVCR
jgi:hypothetical protein